MKNGKVAGPGGIPAEALKADVNTSVEMLYSLFEEIWEKEEIPAEWKEGYFIKIPKRGDLSCCDNYRGITLFSVPGKVLNIIILERMKGKVDQTLCEQQAGFILIMDWVMKIATKEKRNGIQWTMLTQLDDLDVADDLALLSHSHRQMQDKTELALISAQFGLKINKRNTEILRTNAICETPIMLEGETLEEVKGCRYLGSIVDTYGGTEDDVKKRISKARVAFHLLRNVWKSKLIGETTRIRLFNTNVKSVLLYGAETWRINKTALIRIHIFVNHYLRRILRIHWMDRGATKTSGIESTKPK